MEANDDAIVQTRGALTNRAAGYSNCTRKPRSDSIWSSVDRRARKKTTSNNLEPTTANGNEPLEMFSVYKTSYARQASQTVCLILCLLNGCHLPPVSLAHSTSHTHLTLRTETPRRVSYRSGNYYLRPCCTSCLRSLVGRTSGRTEEKFPQQLLYNSLKLNNVTTRLKNL